MKLKMDKQELKNKYGNEKVLCVRKYHYDLTCDVYKKQGDNYEFVSLLDTIERAGYYDLRYEVETDEKVLQGIPYIVLKSGDKYFVTKRLAGDARLTGMIGFLGGHIDPSDLALNLSGRGIDPLKTINNGAARELSEEVGIVLLKNKYPSHYVGVFNDTSNDVSKVHVCVLLIVEIEDMESVKVLETEKLEGLWLDINELGEYSAKDKMENWAVITYKKLKELYPPVETVEQPKKKQTRKTTKVTKEEE